MFEALRSAAFAASLDMPSSLPMFVCVLLLEAHDVPALCFAVKRYRKPSLRTTVPFSYTVLTSNSG